MKTIASVLATLGVAALAGPSLAAAQSAPGPLPTGTYGTVVSATPVTSQVVVQRPQCVQQQGYAPRPTTGGGALVGGALGGLLGNQIGAGAGRAVATGLGAVAGLIAGNGVEAASTPPVPVTTENCVYTNATEVRVIGYDVVYDFAGRRYTARTATDPGPTIPLSVRPAGQAVVAAAAPYPYPAPVAVAPSPAYVAAYAPYDGPPAYDYPPFGYPGYYGYPYTPVSVGLGFGFGGGWHGGGHRWR